MTIRKRPLLLIGVALAVTAFTAPSVAQGGDEWYRHSGQDVKTLTTTTEGGETVFFTGTLTTTKFPIKQTCENTTAHTRLWNPEVEETHTATGEISSLSFDTLPCTVAVFTGHGYTDIAGCEIVEVTSSFPAPWHVNVATGTNGIDIEGVNLTHVYSGCGAIGIPNGAKLSFSGTVTGTWNNANGCIEFNKSGHLQTPVGEKVELDGSICHDAITLR